MAEAPLIPGQTIGILGGGQLGRMLAVAAAQLGLRAHIFSDDPNAPAFDVAATRTVARYDDRSALAAFAETADVATFEFENVPAAALRAVAVQTPVHPSPEALALSQDRLKEKEFLVRHGIGVAPFRPVETPDQLAEAVATIGVPAVFKTRRLGYDGKGQVRLESDSDLPLAVEILKDRAGLVEAFVEFTREISVVLARDRGGATRTYDPSENFHEMQLLKRSVVPAGASLETQTAARRIAEEIAGRMEFVGVLCVEFFECREAGKSRLLVNEIAPRVHNSGHWTLDGCLVSQFENHIRAIAGWPLGGTQRHSDAEMINLVGREVANWRQWAGDEHVALHLYGKGEARAGRKMGHVTRLTPKCSPV